MATIETRVEALERQARERTSAAVPAIECRYLPEGEQPTAEQCRRRRGEPLSIWLIEGDDEL